MPVVAPQMENMTQLEIATSVLMILIVAYSAWTDLRSRRILNGVTLGGALAGLALNAVSGGLGGALVSLGGWLTGAGILFLFFALGALGAGDVKLLAAVGALKGPSFVFNAFLYTGLAGGILAIFVVVHRRKVSFMFAGLTSQIQNLVYTGGISRSGDPKASPLRFPYGLAIAAGSVAALFWGL